MQAPRSSRAVCAAADSAAFVSKAMMRLRSRLACCWITRQLKSTIWILVALAIVAFGSMGLPEEFCARTLYTTIPVAECGLVTKARRAWWETGFLRTGGSRALCGRVSKFNFRLRRFWKITSSARTGSVISAPCQQPSRTGSGAATLPKEKGQAEACRKGQVKFFFFFQAKDGIRDYP